MNWLEETILMEEHTVFMIGKSTMEQCLQGNFSPENVCSRKLERCSIDRCCLVLIKMLHNYTYIQIRLDNNQGHLFDLVPN
ncbi:hypothetical protein L345_06890, partial [Ophiophagus hannah]